MNFFMSEAPLRSVSPGLTTQYESYMSAATSHQKQSQSNDTDHAMHHRYISCSPEPNFSPHYEPQQHLRQKEFSDYHPEDTHLNKLADILKQHTRPPQQPVFREEPPRHQMASPHKTELLSKRDDKYTYSAASLDFSSQSAP